MKCKFRFKGRKVFLNLFSVVFLFFRCLAMYLIFAATNGETLYVLVSSELVYVVKKRSTDDQEIVLTVKYSEMVRCSAVVQSNTNGVDVNYLEFLSNTATHYSKNGKPKKSLVKCSSYDIAVEVR